MAEIVQQRIEEMLPELEQMKRIELFTEKETRAILRKRKAYEYKLRRKTKQKEDFLQYIQYETNVLSLVKKRRQKTGFQFKKVEIDMAIINRIHRLFRMACARFSSDVTLWLSYIDYCKRRKEKGPVGNLFVKMLQVHNKKPELWVLAAKWELEENLSMENARMLLQRGLRFNTKSQHLWQEYFRMELLNAEKLRKRREVLGLAALSKEEVDVSEAVLEGQVAVVVFKKAVDAIPDNVQFCLSFLPICKLFDFARHVEEEIFSYLKITYPGNELTWEAVALRALKSPDELDQDLSKKEREKLQFENELEVADIFQKALKEINTEKMWSLYIKFCQTQLMKKSSRKMCDKRADLLLTAFQTADDEGKLSAELYATWVDVLCHLGRVDVVPMALCRGLSRHPRCVTLWLVRLRFIATTSRTVDEVKSVIEEALNSVKEKESYLLWELSLSWAKLHCPDYADVLLNAYINSVRTESKPVHSYMKFSSLGHQGAVCLMQRFVVEGVMKCPEVSVPLKKDYLQWALYSKGVHSMREVYRSLSVSQPLSIEFFQTYIDLENSQAKPSIKRIRQAYEDAIKHYGNTSIEIWLDYIKLEMTHPKGKPQEAGQIHWRAMKTLNDELTEKFITLYTLLQTGHV